MSFKELLREKLKDEPYLNLDTLPSGFQRLGDIIVLNLGSEFDDYKMKIGGIVLNAFKVRSVCNKFGEIKGEFREPQIEVIAGSNDTIVNHVEHGIIYRFDLRKVMFAKGNLNERVRYPKLVKDGEVIVDMFTGLGYFSLPIAKLSKPKIIYSIELNPISFSFLEENIILNHIKGIEAINGNNKGIIDDLVANGIKADRVLMGYLPPPMEFLPWAFRIIKRNGIIHYEDILTSGKEEEEGKKVVNMINEIASGFGFKVQLIHLQDVKSYGPKRRHCVFDLMVSDS